MNLRDHRVLVTAGCYQNPVITEMVRQVGERTACDVLLTSS